MMGKIGAFTNLLEDWNLSSDWNWDADIMINMRSIKNRQQLWEICRKIQDLIYHEFYANYYVEKVMVVTEPTKLMGAHLLIKWLDYKFLGFDEDDVFEHKRKILLAIGSCIEKFNNDYILSIKYNINTMIVRPDEHQEEESEDVSIED